MKHNGIYWETSAVKLGELVEVRDLLAERNFRPEDWQSSEQTTVSISPLNGAELAAGAAIEALAGWDREALGMADSPTLHLYAALLRPEFDSWPPACYVLDQAVGAGRSYTLSIMDMSNSMATAIGIAAGFLGAAPPDAWAMVTGGDHLSSHAVKRWEPRDGFFVGDAGAAVVLSRRGGYAEMISSGRWTEPSLEGLIRGIQPVTPPAQGRKQVRDDVRRLEFLLHRGQEEVGRLLREGVPNALEEALSDADMKLDDARWVVLPFFGRDFLQKYYFQPLAIDPAKTLLELGTRLGHLGSCDPVAAVDWLHRENKLRSGDRMVIISVGTGYTWTTHVLEAL